LDVSSFHSPTKGVSAAHNALATAQAGTSNKKVRLNMEFSFEGPNDRINPALTGHRICHA
jgi:hypothetical protein